ncbi:hypothetical protein Thimo_1446 [Thioflavicoccus mobilis 8321]|uniref:TVP38/TMEM64 family membrane protein n=1 Tax=Thioflavicoccus mobilis 8321 TaxID=765912 RepID=L0GW67_9GAMM|nr:VTT domain-containing protein [Thioflavicoccus mobilis]AGA90236.1 hypothetical protein Thimo_1446 [Thioflavicoccus mobilis 8321]
MPRADAAQSLGPNATQARPRRRHLLVALIGVAAVMLILLLLRLPLADWLTDWRTRADDLGLWAPIAIIAVFYVLTVAALPTPLVVAASGATLGLWAGFLGIWIGYMLAVATVWVISRWWAEPVRARFIRLHADAERILAAIAHRGGWLVFLTQLHPMSPNGVFNWLYPSLGIKARHALPAIGLGRAPTIGLYTALGAWSVEGTTADNHGWWWLASALVAIAILVVIGRLVSRALREALRAPP